MIKLGIIGAGRLGSFHADKASAHPDVELVGVSDPLEGARNNIANKHGIKAYENPEELTAGVDAVVIAAPTVKHHQVGMACLKQGRHVLMEKPMCVTWNDARDLVEAARRSNTVMQVGHVEEFNPAWQAAKSLLGDIGVDRPVLIDAVRTSGYTFRSTDIGTVLDMMIHDIDLVLSLVPSRVTTVEAIGMNVIGGPHEDIADVRICFENGSAAKLFSSRVEQVPTREMKLRMPDISVRVDFGSRVAEVCRPKKDVLDGNFVPGKISQEQAGGLAPAFMKEHFATETIDHAAVDALACEMDDFVRAIRTGTPPRVSGERGLAAVAVAEAILDSIKQGAPLHFGHVGQRHVA